MTHMNRRNWITLGLAAPAVLAAQQQPPKPDPRGPRQDLELVKTIVIAGHGNPNIPRAQELLSENPKLVNAAHDWGGGDWETALGGAGHTRSREMAHFLIENGARIDAFCAAMLGYREVVRTLL